MNESVFFRGLAFGRAVLRHVGSRTLPVVCLVGLGSLLEGASILLLLPLLAGLFDGASPIVTIGVWDLDLGFSTSGPGLAFLLGVFAALLLVRVVVLWMRDRLLASLQVESTMIFLDGAVLDCPLAQN